MNHRPLISAHTAALCTLALFLGGCAASRDHGLHGSSSHSAPAARVALVTASGAPAGQATLRELPGGAGVEIAIQVQDMAPGPHGFHIHAEGVCAPGPDAATGQTVAFGAAGGHFDPFMTRKHGRPGQSAHEAHAGEAPNILVGADRQGSLRFTNPNVTLQPGQTSVMGRTLVVHEREDDYATNPAGNSGGRIACGVITPAPRS
ncbi:superoxide dismutase family protein [Pantoea sp. 18069]|uniref:superoxide dismutase family protein n=1 Tax=Pantoea sp. 18069 TaxID=2681415 RepID=UPI00135A6E9B|nr:superoxide dismutase family protein [Pantoea sp. 18069]